MIWLCSGNFIIKEAKYNAYTKQGLLIKKERITSSRTNMANSKIGGS